MRTAAGAESILLPKLLAVWSVTQWVEQGCPSKVRVIELGPGKGTLLTDVLRVSAGGSTAYTSLLTDCLPSQTFKALPKHSSPPVTSIHLVENSDALRDEQKAKLSAEGFGGVPTSWYSNVAEISKGDNRDFHADSDSG